MFWFKGCPKCGGDLHRTRLPFEGGVIVYCLQCSYTLSDAQAVRLERPSPTDPTSLARAA